MTVMRHSTEEAAKTKRAGSTPRSKRRRRLTKTSHAAKPPISTEINEVESACQPCQVAASGAVEPTPVPQPGAGRLQSAGEVEEQLIAATGAPPDEAILAKLASREYASVLELQTLQAQLSDRKSVV